MPDDNAQNEVPPIYHPRPARWLPKAHASADLGYVGYDPPRPNQEEDALTEQHVQKGLILNAPVAAESWTAVDTAKKELLGAGALSDLEDLMNLVFLRRAENVPTVPPSTFKMPTRVTLPDKRREAWFRDLANSSVPLQKLGKSVPHRLLGHEVLDLLHGYGVAVPRALWFLRVSGGNELAGLRNKPSYHPTQYSIEWANTMGGYLKRQLAEIGLPSAPRAGLNIKQTFKGVLSDPDSRSRWVSRFQYSLDLLREFYAEGLVDNKTYLWWLVQQMSASNLAQLGFVVHLADEYLDGILCCRALARPFVDTCLSRLTEIRASGVQDGLASVEALLINLIQRTALARQAAFINPRTWMHRRTLIQEILTLSAPGDSTVPAHPAQELFAHVLEDITVRNDAMLLKFIPSLVSQPKDGGSAVADLQLLNSISAETDITVLEYLDPRSDDTSPMFVEKLQTLLSWSTCHLQDGPENGLYRSYAAVTLLQQWRERMVERATRKQDLPPPLSTLQDHLFDWLDLSDVTENGDNVPAVALLFGELIQKNLFSYDAYIQRLISRGESGLSFAEEQPSRHRAILRSIPLADYEPSLVNQRKATLHGVRAREIPEQISERSLRKEIRAFLPACFEGAQQDNAAVLEEISDEPCPTVRGAPRYEVVKTIRQWFMPILRKYLIRQLRDGAAQASTLTRNYRLAICLLTYARCHSLILEVALLVLEHASTPELLAAVVETLRGSVYIWVSMAAVRQITESLWQAHQHWRSKGIQSQVLLSFIIEIDHQRYLPPPSREQVHADIASLTHALAPASEAVVVPGLLPEILLLAGDPSADAPSLLASGLWYKYRTAPNWALNVWDNAVASLQHVPAMMSDDEARRICALSYASFLAHVDQHLPTGLNPHVRSWCEGPGMVTIETLESEVWDVLRIVLVALAVQGVLPIMSILQGFIKPVWTMAAHATAEIAGPQAVALDAVERLSRCLMFGDHSHLDSVDCERLRIRRNEVYDRLHFQSLVDILPILVRLEQNLIHEESVRNAMGDCRRRLCVSGEFKQAVIREPLVIREVFVPALEGESSKGAMREPMLDALRLALGVTSIADIADTDFKDMASLLAPCKITATGIALQFTMDQWEKELAHPETHAIVQAHLDEFTAKFFNVRMSLNQASFIMDLIRFATPAILSSFVNGGMQALLNTLHRSRESLHTKTGEECLEQAGDVLRLVASMIAPLRERSVPVPLLEGTVRAQLLQIIFTGLEAAEACMTAEEASDVVQRQGSTCVVFLARLLQFTLGFSGSQTSHSAHLPMLPRILFRMLSIYGVGPLQDLSVFAMLFDTTGYVLDELNIGESLDADNDPFRHYRDNFPINLPGGIPGKYREWMRFLVPYVDSHSVTLNLSQVSADSHGAHTITPVQNRPWEWTEHLGDPPSSQEGKDGGIATIPNSASLSLEVFAAHLTGDRILSQLTDGTNGSASGIDTRTEGTIRAFEDGLSAESVFKRDWRQTLLDLGPRRGQGFGASGESEEENGEEDGDEVGALPQFPHRNHGTSDSHSRSGSRRTSPASSVHSGGHIGSSSMSATASTESGMRSSPMQVVRTSSASGSDPARAGDALKKASKRKQPVEADDEIEILDGPPPAASGSGRAGKKVKQSAAKPKAKKK